MADGEEALARLREEFPEAIVATGSFRNQHWVEVRPERLQAICRRLRDGEDTAYEMLLDVTAAHWPDEALPVEVVYHVFSFERNDRLRIKVRVPDRGPVPTLTGVWRSAEWNEREAFDMFGVVFEGHPDLRRILMPDDYTEFPLRKELPLYRG